MNKFSLTINDIKRETSETCTICFKQPGLRKIRYKSGQFMTLFFRINGRQYSRSYSFSSSPSINNFLEITVKKIPGGIVSNYINDILKIGDVVEVSEPMGTFIVDESKQNENIYLWGVGSGITPLYSILNEILVTNKAKSINLIYGNKNKDSSIFYDQLRNLQKQFSNIFNLINFYSQEINFIENEVNLKGRISSNFILNLISKDDLFINSIHYICGPRSMKDLIKNELSNFGLPSNSIFEEEFELVIDSKEFNSITNSNVNINFKEKEYQIFVPIGKSILEAALDNNIEIPYSCQTGNCDTCLAKVKSGELKMLGMQNKRKDLTNNEYLLCCSYPLTNQVFLEVEKNI